MPNVNSNSNPTFSYANFVKDFNGTMAKLHESARYTSKVLHDLTKDSERLRANFTAEGSEAVIVVDGFNYLVSVKPTYDEAECEHLNQTTRKDAGHTVVDCGDCGEEAEA